MNEEIGYFKIFLARQSCPRLDAIVQNPFVEEERADGSYVNHADPQLKRWWSTEIVEVIQRRTFGFHIGGYEW